MADDRLVILDGDPKEKLIPQLHDIGRVPAIHRPNFEFKVTLDDAEYRKHPAFSREFIARVHINGLEAQDGSGDF